LRISNVAFDTLLHVNESPEHSLPSLTQLIAETILGHPKQPMLEDIAGSCRSATRIAHAPVQRRATLLRVICAAVQDIGIVKHRLTGWHIRAR